MSTPTYFMHIHTGSVDSRESWLEEVSPEEFGVSLVEVELEDDSQVPEDFNPCESNLYDWVEVQ